jgi:hypothetical protein
MSRVGGGLQIFSRARREIYRLSGPVDDDIGRRELLGDGIGHSQHQIGAVQQGALARLRRGRVLPRVRQKLPQRDSGPRNQIASLEQPVLPA